MFLGEHYSLQINHNAMSGEEIAALKEIVMGYQYLRRSDALDLQGLKYFLSHFQNIVHPWFEC